MKYIVTTLLALLFLLGNCYAEENILTKAKRDTPLTIEEKEVDEYPDARYIWDYLHELRYNDFVSAGILGNIMVECGAFTLELQATIETSSYYGMCQWSKKYYPGVIGYSLESQCDFLRDTIQYEIDTFGSCYKKDFNYSSFLDMNNAREAALAFAKSYERCNSGSYTLRQDCAENALEYFSSQDAPGSTET